MRDLENVYQLLQIATLSQQWPELHPLRDRALEALKAEAKAPAHTPPQQPPANPPKRNLTNG